jgi:hypothetical protein
VVLEQPQQNIGKFDLKLLFSTNSATSNEISTNTQRTNLKTSEPPFRVAIAVETADSFIPLPLGKKF